MGISYLVDNLASQYMGICLVVAIYTVLKASLIYAAFETLLDLRQGIRKEASDLHTTLRETQASRRRHPPVRVSPKNIGSHP